MASGNFQNSDLSSAIRIAEAAMGELAASGRESVLTENLQQPGSFAKSSAIAMAVEVIRTILEAKLKQIEEEVMAAANSQNEENNHRNDDSAENENSEESETDKNAENSSDDIGNGNEEVTAGPQSNNAT